MYDKIVRPTDASNGASGSWGLRNSKALQRALRNYIRRRIPVFLMLHHDCKAYALKYGVKLLHPCEPPLQPFRHRARARNRGPSSDIRRDNIRLIPIAIVLVPVTGRVQT